jgi:hypothetical protein
MSVRVSKMLDLEGRVCTICNIYKSKDNFYVRQVKSGKTLYSYCRICSEAKNKEHRASNIDKYKEARIKRLSNPENREKDRASKAKWKKANKLKVRESRRLLMARKSKEDVGFRLSCRMRTRIWEMLGQKKSKRTFDYVGCSLEELKTHLEKSFEFGMTWDNYGVEWHVDHIRPLSSFNLKDESELMTAFHFSNLQALWKTDNLKKSNKLNWKKEINYV